MVKEINRGDLSSFILKRVCFPIIIVVVWLLTGAKGKEKRTFVISQPLQVSVLNNIRN